MFTTPLIVSDGRNKLNPLLDEDVNNGTKTESTTEQNFLCYENYTAYYPVYLEVQFWVEGVLLIG